jgi:hypothetical protein
MRLVGDIEVRIERTIYDLGYRLFIRRGEHILSSKGEWLKQEPGIMMSNDAGIPLPDGSLQEIANALGEMGIYPSSVKNFQGELKAKDAHLQDLRQLVFKSKEIL